MVAVVLLVLSASGCGIFDPDETDGPPPPPPIVYPILDRPERVLQALQLAYENRDSVKYKDLYDSTYTGTSFDVNGNETLPISYTDELRHIGAIARTPGIATLFDMGPEQSWDVQPSDDPSHPEWRVIQISGSAYRVEVTDGPTTHQAKGEPGTFQEFAFTPTQDASSPTGAYWKIVRWIETGNSTPPPPDPS
ncbi:MAG TPA: hypothetical protein VFP58_02705 [Candidatus Eisenbacteria bacterium]|nr:hypothetical protein [Candidatus Eisenbacteria bacterium]